MRNHGILIALVAALVLAAAVGTALAQPGADGRAAAESRRDDARAHKAANGSAADDDATRGNASARADAAKARHAELKAARESALASFKENRTAALEAFHAANDATRASFLENKTKVIEACRAARNESRAANETADPKCVQKGLKPLVEKARAEHQAHREAFLETVHEARKAAMEAFGKAKSRADAHRRDG